MCYLNPKMESSRKQMFSFLSLLLVLSVNLCQTEANERFCTINLTNHVECVDLLEHVRANISRTFDGNSLKAWSTYTNDINQTGWARLEVTTNPSLEDDDQAYAAGLLEGALTWDLIDLHWNNVLEGICKGRDCAKMTAFVAENMQFMNTMIEKHQATDPFWHHVMLIYKQIQGLQDGYLKTGKGENQANLLWINLLFELYDIGSLYNTTHHVKTHHTDHCSALIKPLADGSDLFVSHNSWFTYSAMIRFVKKYNFTYHQTDEPDSKVIPGQAISFSSYPGVVYSFDDYYITSAGLVIQETTNGNFNSSNTKKHLIADKIVFQFVRNMLANRLANSGQEWATQYVKYNSGTYNNQFMVVDYKQFYPGTPVASLRPGTLWIVEQMPGLTHSSDVTDVLIKQGYWASYNVPYFKDIFEISGYADEQTKFGDFFTHDKCPRAQIFARDQVNVKNMSSLYFLMRYNDFEHDPLGKCSHYNLTCKPDSNAKFAIASRQELNDPNGTYPIEFIKSGQSGAIDVKMTNFQMVKNLQMIAESGPTRVQQPVFEWKTFRDKSVKHLGQPDKWAFPPIKVNWMPGKVQILEL